MLNGLRHEDIKAKGKKNIVESVYENCGVAVGALCENIYMAKSVVKAKLELSQFDTFSFTDSARTAKNNTFIFAPELSRQTQLRPTSR